MGRETTASIEEGAPAKPLTPPTPPTPASPSAAALTWRVQALVFGAALLLRTIFLLELSQAPFFSFLLGDSLGYHLWAERLAGGDWIGEGVFYQAPLYPYWVGLLYRVFGVDPVVVKMAQALLEAVSCCLLAGASQRFFASGRAGLWTGLLAAVYAPAIFFVTLVQKATLGFFLTSVVLNLLGRIHQSGDSGRRTIALGLALGFLALTRENTLVFIPLIAAWVGLRSWRNAKRRAVISVALLIMGSCVPLGVVGLRNLFVGGEFALTTSQFGTNFFIGNNANAEGFYLPLRRLRGNVRYERDDATALAEEATGRSLSPGEVSSFWTEKALDYIEEEPVDWLLLMARKAALVWNRVEASDSEDIAVFRHFSWLLDGLGRVAHFGLIVPLAAAGIWASRGRWRELWILYAMLAVYAASLTLFFLFARYRVPLIPISLIFAAHGALACWERVAARDGRGLLAIAGVMASAAIVGYLPLTDTGAQRAATYKNFGGELLERGEYQQAIRFFERSLVDRPENAESRLGIAQSLAYLGQIADAREAFVRATEADPENALAWRGLGQVELREGRLEEGSRALERAAQLDPTDHQAFYYLGMHHAHAGRHRDAVLWLRRSADREAEPYVARLELAKALYQLGDLHGVRTESEWILERAPDNIGAALLLSQVLEEAGDIGRARALARRVLRVQPRNIAAREQLERIDRTIAREGRIRALEAAVEERPTDLASRIELSRAYGTLRRWSEAETQLDHALALAPGDASLRTELGFVLARLGRDEEAITAFERALELDPGNPNPHFHLGRLAEQRADAEAAKGHYARALEIAPDHARSREALRRLAEEAGAGTTGRRSR